MLTLFTTIATFDYICFEYDCDIIQIKIHLQQVIIEYLHIIENKDQAKNLFLPQSGAQQWPRKLIMRNQVK